MLLPQLRERLEYLEGVVNELNLLGLTSPRGHEHSTVILPQSTAMMTWNRIFSNALGNANDLDRENIYFTSFYPVI